MTFDGGGACQNSKLNTVTKKLRDRLSDAGWSGTRLVDEKTWPEDFWEASVHTNGFDGTYGDAYRLSVFAGHGNAGFLFWGHPSPFGECFTEIPFHSRLGRFAGDTAAAVMLLSSCTLQTDVARDNFEWNAVRQVLGFHNSPYIAGGEPRDVFKRTQDGQSTKDAWLDEMENNAAPGKNSPVVLTLGMNGSEAMQAHGATNLASGEGFLASVVEPDNAAEPLNGHWFEWLNNGCSPTCLGACPSATPAELPDMPVDSLVPVVHVERPRRTSDGLAVRAAMLLSLLQGQSVGSEQRAALEEWARRAITTGDVTVVKIPGQGKLQAVYQPATDRLVVDDLDAREAAQPGISESPDGGRRAGELSRAMAVRDELLRKLSAIPGDLIGLSVGRTFSLGTREAGLLERGGMASASIPFEYTFSTFGEFAGYPVFDVQLEIGVTRHGRLSRIAVSSLEVRRAGSAVVMRTPADAFRGLQGEIVAMNPGMLRHDMVVAQVGISFPSSAASSGLAAPELVAEYVVVYPGNGTTPAVSRRYPVSMSLISPSGPVTREPPYGIADDPGDPRHEARRHH